nr:hypothetical protein [Tanacetum cinerariifolium]
MSTRSSARNLFSPLDNPKLKIRRRPRVDPTLLNDFEIATNGNGDDVPPPRGGNGYHQMDKIQAKPDKTEHETESVEKSKVNQSL